MHRRHEALSQQQDLFMDNEILKIAKKWSTNNYFEEQERLDLIKIIKQAEETNSEKANKELTERFYKDIEFGTGGLRSIIGFGRNRMNKYTVRKATHAMALTLKETFKNEEIKVAISYDTRHCSLDFAKETASVMAANGIKSFIFDKETPVPLLSFSVRYHEAHAGIMITASHNPKEYNGYKAYWSDGAQVTPPYDNNIISNYNKIEDFSTIPLKDFNQAVDEGLVKWVGQKVKNNYYDKVLAYNINKDLCKEKGDHLKIVYTPLHGTGLECCKHILDRLGFTNLHVVKEQAIADPNFSTTESPNPEDPVALKLALDLMKEKDADLALATDPDADRLGVALMHDGNIEFLNGNQIAVLMLNYILNSKKKNKILKDNSYVVKTIVTSELQTALAKHYGVEIYSVLTGFKWLCGKMRDFEEQDLNKNFIYASEESFGYLIHEHARDKDAVSAVGLFCEMALWYKERDMTLVDALNQIFEQHGFYHEGLLSIYFEGKEGVPKMNSIMEYFRNFPETSMCGEEISKIDDIKILESKDLTTGKTSTINLPQSNVLGFHFKSGNILWARPSGTEPKIKFYIMIKENQGNLAEKKEKALKKCDDFVSFLKEKAHS